MNNGNVSQDCSPELKIILACREQQYYVANHRKTGGHEQCEYSLTSQQPLAA